MSYNYSNLDKDNLKWFLKDNSCATLKTIKVVYGQIRGLRKITVDFRYPITAIAGRNGSCKTTVLTLAACAFHNISSGFKLAGRIHSYYTFSEFFIQTKEEKALGDIQIRYEILHDRWKSGALPGAGWQSRKKKSGGRWNNYELDASAMAGKHNEFYEAAKILSYDKTVVASHLIKSAFDSEPEESQKIINFVRSLF
jgi:hypothetical protein